jgi:hypothetical protein
MPLTITVPLPDECVQRLRIEAQQQNITLEELAIQYLRQSFSNHQETQNLHPITDE